MTAPLASFEVHNHEIGGIRRLELVDVLDVPHLEFVEHEWTPKLTDARARAILAYHSLSVAEQTGDAWQRKQMLFGAPDSHWDWRDKKVTMLGLSNRMLAIADGECIEALVRLDLSKPSRIYAEKYTPIVYVDYLAVAPWNRSPIQAKPRFKGLGKLMLGVAVSLSISEGMEGRCGLHSLPQSEGFYVRAGMRDLGVDSAAEELRYFEFPPEDATNFLRPKL